jgi:UDP-N-acetylmuramoylalanine--D-glutamate ligase
MSAGLSVGEKLKNKKILVVGAGTTGKSIVNFLVKSGLTFEIFDEKVDSLNGLPVLNEIPNGVEIALVSPGWRKDHEIFETLSNAEVISELDLAWQLKQELAPNQKWIAVTGTNGKTTTVQMVESILGASNLRAIACGNVGLTVIEAVTSPENFEVLAIELSSFQIDWSELPEFEASAILNISDDHIDWHGSFDAYANAKLKLLAASKIAILNLNDPEIALRTSAHGGRKIYFSLDTPQAGELGLVEEVLVDRAFVSSTNNAEVIAELKDISPAVPHNISNALAAAGLALSVEIPHPVITKGLQDFKLDHHRLELILTKDGIDWVDDSKATNPHAAKAALASYLSSIWIAGGLAKSAKMGELINKSAKRIKAAILIGTDRDLIASELEKQAPHIQIIKVEKTGTSSELMESVVSEALKIATPGDTVLLAPACASMDQFKSYAERGDLFAQAVKKLV